MFAEIIDICYPLLLILSISGKKSFENLGNVIQKSSDTVSRLLRPHQQSLNHLGSVAQNIFTGKKVLILAIDDTLLKKIHSLLIEGTGMFFDTKISRRIKAFKLLVGTITDGEISIPICGAFMFPDCFLEEWMLSKEQLVERFLKIARKLFPAVRIIVAADGLFATYALLKWLIENSIEAEMRMASNRVVVYKGKKVALKEIKNLYPRGRQMARTISVIWKDLPLEITAVRRIDKHGDETIIFQAATFKAKPSEHAAIYKKRWVIEKTFRTSKQYLGLQECFSRKIDKQFDHVCAVLLAYAFAQVQMRRQHLDNPEAAIKAIKRKNTQGLKYCFDALARCAGIAYA